MAEAAQLQIQDDIARAFSVKAQRTFYRENNQVYAIVGANPELKVVSDVWFDRFDTQQEFQDVLKYILSLFHTGRYRYWLADLRFLKSEFGDSEHWLVNTLVPAIVGAGLQREAVVLPDTSSCDDVKKMYSTATHALEVLADEKIRGFHDIALARRWLLEGETP
ncbi:hypothetical protein PUV54_06170 [Hyphococcus flavus]|uniref:STAS/SEC14 domain-containing protein n=1 Tax=Hyphococcus flavus TaxID=1866326 RepID=A0AAE9ZKE2_9PROT|nr:hypothetical protein [Hyphococcus flavus]WDI32781.1 hypothetical protein PUV54_06170 [Hyphococcus flavus]